MKSIFLFSLISSYLIKTSAYSNTSQPLTPYYTCNGVSTLYINESHPYLSIIPTNDTRFRPNMLCSWKIFFTASDYNTSVFINLENYDNINPYNFTLKVWNCQTDGKDLLANAKNPSYTREKQICVLFITGQLTNDDSIWNLKLNLTNITRYIPPRTELTTPIHETLTVTKSNPLKSIIIINSFRNTVASISMNTIVTVNATEGTLEVFLVFNTATNTSIGLGIIYVYDSSDLTNFQAAIDPTTNEYYRQVASNRSVTIFYVCQHNGCYDDHTKIQIVYRILDYHSINCNNSVNENLVYAPSFRRTHFTMSALNSGSCPFSIMVPYMDQAPPDLGIYATLNIEALDYRGNSNVKVIYGYLNNGNNLLFEFNQKNAPLWKNITLYGDLISFIIPPDGILNILGLQSIYYKKQIEQNFNESSLGVIMSPSYTTGISEGIDSQMDITIICTLGAANFNITIIYADFYSYLEISGYNDQQIFQNETIKSLRSLSFTATTDVKVQFIQHTEYEDDTGYIDDYSEVYSRGFLIRYEAAYNKENATSKFHIWIIYAGVGAFVVITVLLTIFFIRRMKSSRKRFEQMNALLRYMNFPKEDIEEMQRKSDEFLIDPTNLHIYFGHQIGQGSTSSVYKGHIVGPAPLHTSIRTIETQHFTDCDVAIKLASNFGQNEVGNLLQEINAMKKIGSHQNVISFLGWCMYKEAPCLAFELAEQDLLTYVQSFREKVEDVSQRVFLSILWQITQGMQYIASRGLIHRDLAARNILLCDNQIAKISDFGLCCNPGQNLIYQATLSKRLPMKWLSIEALTNRIFSERSDVWSFGILVHEMYSLGNTPYADMDNTEVLEFLQSGRRLEKSDLVSEDLYNLMRSCWEEEPLNRPTFSELSANFRQMLEDVTKHCGYLD